MINRAILGLMVLLFIGQAANAQPAKQRVSGIERQRILGIGTKALKFTLTPFLKAEKSKLFRFRKPARIATLEALMENPEILEIYLEGEVDKVFTGDIQTISEFGDGVILQKWLDFLGSEGFQSFVENLLPLLEKVFQLIGTLESKPGGSGNTIRGPTIDDVGAASANGLKIPERSAALNAALKAAFSQPDLSKAVELASASILEAGEDQAKWKPFFEWLTNNPKTKTADVVTALR